MRPTGKEAVTAKGGEQSGGRVGDSPGSAGSSPQSRKGSPPQRNLTSPATKEATDAGTPALSALSPRPTREPSMLINVRNVWADEAAAAAAGRLSLGEEAASPRSSASHQEAPSSEFWRPRHMISQMAASPKTSTDSRFHCNQRDAFLVSFGFCLGVSGFWRFPALMAEHGASFLLACMVIYVLMAQPVFYLELAMGQFVGSGVTRLNKCFPLLNGIGYVTVWYCFLLASCHSLRVTYAVFFLLYGSAQSVPWSNCRDSWSTDCFTPGTEFLRCKYVQQLVQPAVNESEALAQPSGTYCINASRTPPEAYFTDYVLQRSSGIHEIGAMRFELLVFMTVVWVIVFGVSSQKPDVVHAVYQALSWVAMLCFVPFMVHSTYQHFTIRGLLKILTPDLAVLASSKVWLDAAEHSLFSLGTSSGLVFFLGSRCKYGSCFERCAAWTIVAEMTACDLIALTTCFWVYKPGNTEHEITPAVPFTFRQLVTAAQLVVSCASPTICNALVFTSFVATGLTVNVLLVKTCVAEITAVLNYATSGAYTWTLMVVCGLAYACSIPFCTKGGLYIQNVFEQGIARNLFFIVSLLQVISLVWFYGVLRLCFDLEYMLKDPVGIYWVYCWAFSAPAVLLVCAAVYVSEGAGSASLTIGDYEYPPWVAVFMWLSSGVSLLPVPVMALRHWLRVDMDFSKALGTDPMWGPQDPDLTFDYNDRIRTFVTITPVKGKNDARDKGGFNRTPVLFTASSSFTALNNQLSLE
ncbi:sodium-dependent noradrenaline transporter-like isoform X2 [Dermacentor albipictus]|uniref:sodium-dependent noradrenaline transporter-like isoform X2 n=1 Tax=Dermacentor albipictus TaxID=60249 RepID=UPI0038FC1741